MVAGRVVLGTILAAMLNYEAAAQTNRERAVAIDRIAVPPVDRLEIEEIGPPLAAPWSLAFLPDGTLLVVEKHGGIRRISPDGTAGEQLSGGPPNVLQKADSGLHDIVLDPDFAINRTVYLAFVEGNEESNRTAIWKARLDRDRMVDGRVIFRVNQSKKDVSHPGGRMLFLPDKTLLLTVGDGYDYRDKAQDPASHLGKVLRLTRDGVAAPGNPFIGNPGYAPEIWTLGHRNMQGLTRDDQTGIIWSHEHGPRGGDEINQLVAGRNYGWPKVLWGINYDGKPISDRSRQDGLADPQFFWSPSIAPSGLAVYRGPLFPDWQGKLLVGALAARALIPLRLGKETGLPVEEPRLLTGLRQRIRDVRVSPDGNVYLLTDDERGRLLRVVPPSAEGAITSGHPLSPLAFLIGEWTGASSFTPAFTANPRPTDETSRTSCSAMFKATYIRCATRFARSNGRWRTIELNINAGKDSGTFNVAMFDSNWSGQSRYELRWDEAAQAFVAAIAADSGGRPATERIVIAPATDRNSLTHTEAIRLNSTPDAPWIETFRWTWKRP